MTAQQPLLDSLVSSFGATLGSSLVHGTVLALITLVLTRTLLRNARPALVAALWTIVLLKFLVPIGPEVPISLSGTLDSLLGAAPAAALPIHAAPGADAETAAAVASSDGAIHAWTWAGSALFGLYLMVIAGIVLVRVRQERRVRHWAASLAPADPALVRLGRRVAAVLGLSQAPSLRVCPDLVAPQIVGISRPVVVVPSGYHEDGDGERVRVLEAMLLHEFAHLRRRDTWLRALQLFAATLLFFWPVVRWVNRRIDEEREKACDQWVMAHGRMSATEYARTLLALARRLARADGPDNAGSARGSAVLIEDRASLGMAIEHGRKQLSRRVSSLMRGSSKPRVGLVTGAVLVLYAGISLGHSQRSNPMVAVATDECVVESGLVEYIMVTYPEADTDGDGELSRDEVCAQKKRLAELVAVEDMSSPAADAVSHDPVLAALDGDWLHCESCGCAIEPTNSDTDTIAESDPRFFDKKVCTTN